MRVIMMNEGIFYRYRNFVYGYVFTIFFIVLVTSVMLPHVEGDELIYQTLATKLSSGQLYSLQNTELLRYLSPDIYNTPIFFRPPLFAMYLALFYKLFGVFGLKIAPVLVYIFLCFVIYKIVYLLSKSRDMALKSLVLSSTSTILLFSSVQIRLDLFMSFMTAISFYFLLLFRESTKKRYSFLSGLFFTLAVLTNYTAVLLFPFLLFLLLYACEKKNSMISFFWFLTPMLFILIWFYIFFMQYHMPVSALFSKPTVMMLEKFSYLQYVHDRPFFYYFLTLFIVNPIYLFLFYLFNKKNQEIIFRNSGKSVCFALIGIITFVITFLTVYGIQGGTYQMRYMVLAEPFLIILLSLIPFEKNETLRSLFVLCVLYNLFLVFYNIGYGNADVFTFTEIYQRLHP